MMMKMITMNKKTTVQRPAKTPVKEERNDEKDTTQQGTKRRSSSSHQNRGNKDRDNNKGDPLQRCDEKIREVQSQLQSIRATRESDAEKHATELDEASRNLSKLRGRLARVRCGAVGRPTAPNVSNRIDTPTTTTTTTTTSLTTPPPSPPTLSTGTGTTSASASPATTPGGSLSLTFSSLPSAECSAALRQDDGTKVLPYVLRRQSKLCEMLHRMHVEDRLLTRVKEEAQNRIRHEHRTVDRIEQDSPVVEMGLMNEIAREEAIVQDLRDRLQLAEQRADEIRAQFDMQDEVVQQMAKAIRMMKMSRQKFQELVSAQDSDKLGTALSSSASFATNTTSTEASLSSSTGDDDVDDEKDTILAGSGATTGTGTAGSANSPHGGSDAQAVVVIDGQHPDNNNNNNKAQTEDTVLLDSDAVMADTQIMTKWMIDTATLAAAGTT